jgi:hypothetical protein
MNFDEFNKTMQSSTPFSLQEDTLKKPNKKKMSFQEFLFKTEADQKDIRIFGENKLDAEIAA